MAFGLAFSLATASKMGHNARVDFFIHHQDGKARAGTLTLAHGAVPTPLFMPVGTLGSVKAMLPEELERAGAHIILGNTYHLWLRPGMEIIKKHKDLHRFMHWKRPILTDSGGFQVFSLQGLNKVTEEGVSFRSHLDGSARFLTPEIAMEIQLALGSDIAMAFDQCPPGLSDRPTIEAAMRRTTAWAKRCLTVPAPILSSDTEPLTRQLRFGIVQGGMFPDLRRQHMQDICALPFDGFALGGFSVGEPVAKMYEVLGEVADDLPRTTPRYLMGVGTPQDLLIAVGHGVDLFDCVMPTRNARNGQLFTSTGKINIRQARYAEDLAPLDAACACMTCQTYSRSYLRHLFLCKEISYSRLATMHNIFFYLELMRSARTAIEEGRFAAFQRAQRTQWGLDQADFD